jgi:hypothetical protein
MEEDEKKTKKILINNNKINKQKHFINYIPCGTEYNGKAKIKEYFYTSIKDIEEDENNFKFSSNLRGRLLKGRDINLKDKKYIGFYNI